MSHLCVRLTELVLGAGAVAQPVVTAANTLAIINFFIACISALGLVFLVLAALECFLAVNMHGSSVDSSCVFRYRVVHIFLANTI